MEVWVTRDDIDRGVRASGNGCPIARAVRRALPEARAIWVATMITAVTDCGCLVDQHLTEEQLSFIGSFDAGNAVDPIMIDLQIRESSSV